MQGWFKSNSDLERLSNVRTLDISQQTFPSLQFRGFQTTFAGLDECFRVIEHFHPLDLQLFSHGNFGQSKHLQLLVMTNILLELPLENPPVSPGEEDFGRSSQHLQYFPGKPVSEGSSEEIVRLLETQLSVLNHDKEMLIKREITFLVCRTVFQENVVVSSLVRHTSINLGTSSVTR